MHKQYRYLFLSLLMAVCVCSAASAILPAGTEIPLYAECTYSARDGSRVVRSNPVVFKVRQVSFVECSAPESAQNVAHGKSALFSATVRNLGNGSDSFNLSATADSTGWGAAIYVDTNGDGQMSGSEVRPSIVTPVMAPGASMDFKVLVFPASYTLAGSGGSARFTAASTADGSATATRQLTVSVGDESAIRNWAVLGYFQGSNAELLTWDYLANDGGEANAAPNAAPLVEYWRACTSNTGRIDLSELYGESCPAAAYAGCYAFSDSERFATLWCETGDPLMVWVNGAPVHVSATAPAGGKWEIPVEITPGWNRIVLKSATEDGEWHYRAGLLNESGAKMNDLLMASRPQQVEPVAVTDLQVRDITKDSATVCWQTTAATSTVLEWCKSDGSEFRYEDPALATSHSVRVTGLAASSECLAWVGGADVFGTQLLMEPAAFTTASEPSQVWITRWLLNGPHFNGVDLPSLWWDALPGEDYIQPYDGLVSRGRSWSYAGANESGIVNVFSHLPDFSWGLVYLHAYVYSPVDQDAQLRLGSDGGVRVIFNGNTVFYRTTSRYAADANRVPVKLVAGQNRLMIKLLQHQIYSKLSARFTDNAGAQLTNVTIEADYRQ